jgi:hypothetical protein
VINGHTSSIIHQMADFFEPPPPHLTRAVDEAIGLLSEVISGEDGEHRKLFRVGSPGASAADVIAAWASGAFDEGESGSAGTQRYISELTDAIPLLIALLERPTSNKLEVLSAAKALAVLDPVFVARAGGVAPMCRLLWWRDPHTARLRSLSFLKRFMSAEGLSGTGRPALMSSLGVPAALLAILGEGKGIKAGAMQREDAAVVLKLLCVDKKVLLELARLHGVESIVSYLTLSQFTEKGFTYAAGALRRLHADKTVICDFSGAPAEFTDVLVRQGAKPPRNWSHETHDFLRGWLRKSPPLSRAELLALSRQAAGATTPTELELQAGKASHAYDGGKDDDDREDDDRASQGSAAGVASGDNNNDGNADNNNARR